MVKNGRFASTPAFALRRRLANISKRTEPRPTDKIITEISFPAPNLHCAG
jgi:hypothetical protein